jgi:hypothetical protein
LNNNCALPRTLLELREMALVDLLLGAGAQVMRHLQQQIEQ